MWVVGISLAMTSVNVTSQDTPYTPLIHAKAGNQSAKAARLDQQRENWVPYQVRDERSVGI